MRPRPPRRTAAMAAALSLLPLLQPATAAFQAPAPAGAPPPAPRHEALNVDVLVYSANPAGIGAAIAAANGTGGGGAPGHSVLLMEPLGMIGGMGAAGGVGLMNQGCGPAGATGLGRRWGLLNGARYPPGSPNAGLNLFPDPRVMADSFWALLNATPGVAVRLGCALTGVARGGGPGCLASATFACDGGAATVTVGASVFIDASYDGDVVTGAGGIDYASGREAASEFNESLAGVLALDETNESFDRQNLTVDAFSGPGGTLLPGVSSAPLPPPGTGDAGLMAFAYFPCVTNDPANRVPLPRPEGYDPAHFALLQAQIDGVVANGRYPRGPDLAYFSEYHAYSSNTSKLLLCCGVGPVNCDQPGLNGGWAAANASARAAIAAAHKYYLLGSLYYMANDPRVPAFTRADVGQWGLCADEYTATGNWPPQLYVRISNRLRGAALLTQNNIAAPRSKPDSVAVGCWEFDQHTVSRHAVADPRNASRRVVANEGYMRNDLAAPHARCDDPSAGCAAPRGSPAFAAANWYDVPFGVMLPSTPAQGANLLVPVALSATSVAYSSTRIEQMFMDLGTAAGVAAALALEGAGGALPRGACPPAPLQATNVTAVQAVLTGVYAQRVHGPVV